MVMCFSQKIIVFANSFSEYQLSKCLPNAVSIFLFFFSLFSLLLSKNVFRMFRVYLFRMFTKSVRLLNFYFESFPEFSRLCSRSTKFCFALPHFSAFWTFCVKSFRFLGASFFFSRFSKSGFKQQLLIETI